MTFPMISTKALNVELTRGMENLIDQKLQTLEKLLPENATDIRCEVEVEKVAEHQSGKIHRVEINLFIAGTLYRTEATEDQIEKAIDEARNEMRHELQRALGKRQSLVRRGSRMIKDMLRFGK